ncbi:SpoIID/LytB domain-containing protein [Blastococcus deserti]|uniref:SpoIID/LytB domain-containing protein n=1 Tax=Blastococcus deserti TaxID=2259033 RepID=A0ABW4X4P4_9ACTN
MGKRTRLLVLALVGLLLGGTVGLVASEPAQAAEWFPVPPGRVYTVDGHGYGHGHGMSQRGAQGAATQGLTANQILDFYYPGTTRTNIGTPGVRVLLTATASADLRIDSTAGTPYMYIQDAATGILAQATSGPFRVLTSGTSQRIIRWDGARWVNFSIGGSGTYAGPLAFWTADGATVFAADGSSRNYRGSINVVRTASGVSTAVSHVNMQEYLSGVVPAESPPSWRPAALEAQAVAARSYAWWDIQTPSASYYDICDTTACQVYKGRSIEDPRTNTAVHVTGGTALYYRGAPAFTQFSASNGGAMLAGSQPYLVSKADPYDGLAGNPDHSWTTTLNASYLESAYPQIGTLQGLRVLNRAGLGQWGGYITSLQVVGSKTTVSVSNPRFGLKSTFWRPRAEGNPFGSFDTLEPVTGNKVRATGWTIDPDSPMSSLAVHVYIDGVGSGSFPADIPRWDVNAHYGAGEKHGFDLLLPVTQGRHEICVYAINVVLGNTDTQLGCRTVDTSGLPVGEFESVRIDQGQALVTGWSIDPDDRAAPVEVHAHVNGAVTGIFPANGAHASAGAHGIMARLPVRPGWNEICLYAIDLGSSKFSALGCRRVELKIDPTGWMETATGGAKDITVTGWALDPETTDPVDVHVYVDGVHTGSVTANRSRPDIAAAYPGSGDLHGFAATLPAVPGQHAVCAYAINVLQGSTNQTLGCKTVDVGAAPVGAVDEVSVNGFDLRVRGWALDGDTSDPIDVHVHIDGQVAAIVTASGDRPDVAAAHPGMGAAHGFDRRLSIPSGKHTVCVYAINVLGTKGDPKISCSDVVVNGGSMPIGKHEYANTVDGITEISGWAIEPDLPTSAVEVHFHLDGQVLGITKATEPRAELAEAYPGAGPDHGYTGRFAIPKGWHTVCEYAINAGAGSGGYTALGCQVINVR